MLVKYIYSEDIFCEKCPQTWLFLGEKWPNTGSKFEKMAQKNLIGENGGERKIDPSANPENVNLTDVGCLFFYQSPIGLYL